MNTDRTLQLIREHFGNVTEAATDVVRTERRYRGEPLAVFYFDFSQTVARPDFDLQAYLQQRIASDFYKHEGALQWNYYLNFVLEKAAFQRFRSTPEAAKIEADRTFARKRIWEQETLNADLSQPLAATLQSTKPSQDVASRWVAKLKEAGLERIADPAVEYAQVVRDCLAGETKTSKSLPATQLPPVQNGRFIHRLSIADFRMQPEQKDFEFGMVNLVRGVNGTGKTSLLEAIELCICGGNRRQGGGRPAVAKLHVQFVGQNESERCPVSSAAGYRARDLAWYGGYYQRGNQLCHNFGRFNFFDTDAAFQLSQASSGDEIIKAVNALLLGELATTIEERMRQFQERFGREERALQQRLQIRRKEVGSVSQQIDQLKDIKDTRDALLRELQTKAQGCRWQKLPARPKLDDLAVLQETVEDSAARLAQVTRQIPWLSRVSIGSLNREAKQLAEMLKQMAKHNELAKKHSTALEQNKARMVEIEGELKILRRLQEYYVEPDALSLLGGAAVLKDTRAKLAQLKEATALLRTVDLKKFEACASALNETMAEQETAIVTRRKNLAKLKSRAAEMASKFDAIQKVVEEIKGLGRRFCELKPSSTDCPLCGAHYNQLSAQIASLESGVPMEPSLRELTAEIEREQAALAELEKTTETLTQLQRAAQIVFSANELKSRSTKSLVEHLGTLAEMLAEQKHKLDELTAKQRRLELAGFGEEELQNLFEVAQEEHSLARSKLAKKETVQTLVVERTDALTALRNEGREKEKAQKEAEAELRRLVARLLPGTVVGDAVVELERREKLVEEVLGEARSTQKQVEISDAEEFSVVATRLETFAKAVGRIQEALKRVEEKDALEQRLATSLAEAKEDIAKLEPIHSRAKHTLGVLAKLLGSNYKEAYLQQVVAEHKEKLATIFSRIHAPHEFKDVLIGSNVSLLRDTGVKSAVCEISTGQRAALALSIFLSMNSSVSTRAPWLLFDEPVVHVDDLNILSFLDMLRDLVLLGNRQVFFTTANTRIGDLFAKKFQCLGTEFREFHFRR
jgi:DNA repair exonuclease SbcCD ATPase subunit